MIYMEAFVDILEEVRLKMIVADIVHNLSARNQFYAQPRTDGRPRRGRRPALVEAKYASTAWRLQRGRSSIAGSSGIGNEPARRRRSMVDREVRRMAARSSMKSTSGVSTET
jgi:hypothetical protein